MENFTKDHYGGYDSSKPDSGDICRHHDEEGKGETMLAWIVEPKNKHLYLTKPSDGPPCESTYTHYDMEQEFNNAPSQDFPLNVNYDSSPLGYNFQAGTIPYLLQNSEKNNYFLDEYNDDEEYKSNLVLGGYLSDVLLNSNDKQMDDDFTVSLSKNNDNLDNTIYFNITFKADGIVNSSLENDDPLNNTWTTIQKAVDNMSTLDILVVEKGNYSEDVILNKSLIIFSVDKDNVILDGSITMYNPYDYELLNVTDYFANVNMSGINLLYHFNNDTRVGENYSTSNLVYDYSGLKNNGTNNNASWTTSTIKGSGAFDFNGVNNTINISSISALGDENVTISSWICLDNNSSVAGPIVSQSNASAGYCLFINNSSFTPVFRLDTVEVVSQVNLISGWHNIVGTHNQTTLKIYVDGILQGSTSKFGAGAFLDAFIGFDNICFVS